MAFSLCKGSGISHWPQSTTRRRRVTMPCHKLHCNSPSSSSAISSSSLRCHAAAVALSLAVCKHERINKDAAILLKQLSNGGHLFCSRAVRLLQNQHFALLAEAEQIHHQRLDFPFLGQAERHGHSQSKMSCTAWNTKHDCTAFRCSGTVSSTPGIATLPPNAAPLPVVRGR